MNNFIKTTIFIRYIYENFIKYIDKNRTGNIEKKIRSINEIFNCFTFGDILEKDIMGLNKWQEK